MLIKQQCACSIDELNATNMPVKICGFYEFNRLIVQYKVERSVRGCAGNCQRNLSSITSLPYMTDFVEVTFFVKMII